MPSARACWKKEVSVVFKKKFNLPIFIQKKNVLVWKKQGKRRDGAWNRVDGLFGWLTVLPVPGAPAKRRALPAIFFDLMSSTTMLAASRARSCPTRPAATGIAVPSSATPKPLICVWEAIRWVLVVERTSSIFILDRRRCDLNGNLGWKVVRKANQKVGPQLCGRMPPLIQIIT